jgi:hypothetical protein
MDIAAASVNMSQMQLAQQVNTSVMKLAMDNSKQQATEIANLMKAQTNSMERSVTPYLGGSIDTRV